MMNQIKNYTSLMELPTFEDRLTYLKLHGQVGQDTFGFDRYLNQRFYRSLEWQRLRNNIILRDDGCDLAIPERPIESKIIIHHMNPISVEDIENSDDILNPEYLICVSLSTHNFIHYGIVNYLDDLTINRQPHDTCPWRRNEHE